MVKEIVEFLVSYPTWVKVAIVVLAATMGLLLVIFRPPVRADPVPDPKKDIVLTPPTRVFRIERLESSKSINDISLTISINGQIQKFPTAYGFAVYEQNMSGGEYILPATADEFIVDIRATVQFEEYGFRSTKLRPVILEFQLRQPTRFSENEFPKRGVETLRAIDEKGMRQSPSRKDFNILVHYSVT